MTAPRFAVASVLLALAPARCTHDPGCPTPAPAEDGGTCSAGLTCVEGSFDECQGEADIGTHPVPCCRGTSEDVLCLAPAGALTHACPTTHGGEPLCPGADLCALSPSGTWTCCDWAAKDRGEVNPCAAGVP